MNVMKKFFRAVRKRLNVDEQSQFSRKSSFKERDETDLNRKGRSLARDSLDN